jgi:ribosome biogenesis GTPase A
MTKAIRMMQENIKLVDMIIEVTDARIPLSGRNPDIDELGRSKSRLIILNKADLADPAMNRKWADYFSAQGVLVMEMNSRQSGGVNEIKNMMRNACAEKIERDKKRGIINRPIRAMVAGIPNVGKSTFINHLAGKSSAKTGNKPGVTKGKQWIMLGNQIQLLDTPGILWPKFDDETVGLHLALVGSMNDENLDSGELAISLIHFLDNAYPDVIGNTYHVTREQIITCKEEENLISEEAACLDAIAINRNCYAQGARPDMMRAAALLLDDFRNGKLGRITLEKPE